MQLETKFLRLRTTVTIGSRIGDWEVTWLGGWTRDRLSYLVIVVNFPSSIEDDARAASISRVKHIRNQLRDRLGVEPHEFLSSSANA